MSGRRKDPPQGDNASPARRRRPAPPPPPPKALVGLLKKNKGVLAYFTSLQANLEADVQKWKDRARNYQSLYEEQLAENERLKKDRAKNNGHGKETSTNGSHPARKRQKRTREGSSNKAETDYEEDNGKQKSREARKKKSPPSGSDHHSEDEEEDGPPATINIQNQKQTTNAKQQPGKKKIRDDSRLELQPSTDEEENLGEDGRQGRSKERTDSLINPVSGRKSTPNDAVQTIDEMFELEFELEFESDDDEEDSKDQNGGIIPTAKKKTSKRNKKLKISDKERPLHESAFDIDSSDEEGEVETQTKPPPFWQQQQQFILSELMDAYHCLQYLGIELVERKEVAEEKSTEQVENVTESVNPEEGNADAVEKDDEEEGISFLPDQSDTMTLKRQLAETKDEAHRVLFEPRSNEDVICDVLHTLRSLTRLQIQFRGLPKEYYTFRIPPHWIPCGDRLSCEHTNGQDQVDHPACVAKICLFRALSVMDTYCGAGCLGTLQELAMSSTKDSWEGLFDFRGEEPSMDPESKQVIRIGMRERKEMVDHLIESLHGEISGVWAVADRSARLENAALIYDEMAESQSDFEMDSETENGVDCNAATPSSGGGATDDPKSIDAIMMAAAGTKGQAALSSLAERRILAQLLVNLYVLRKDSQHAFHLVCRYVLSAVPSLELEDYPKVQPVLSLVVLEGMLNADEDFIDVDGVDGLRSDDMSGGPTDGVHDDDPTQSYFGLILSKAEVDCSAQQPSTSSLAMCLRRALSLSVHTTAIIWRQRLQSADNRIADVARIEWAGYLRLLGSQGSWLRGNAVVAGETHGLKANINYDFLLTKQKEASLSLAKDTQQSFMEGTKDERRQGATDASTGFFTSFALSLCFVLYGDFGMPKAALSSALQEIREDLPSYAPNFNIVSSACFTAFRQLEIRLQDRYRQSIGVLMTTSGDGCASECLSSLYQCLKSQAETSQSQHSIRNLAETVLHCCSLVSDGEMAYKALKVMISCEEAQKESHSKTMEERGSITTIEVLKHIAQIPTVRVINLQRRKDRMNLMVSQAMQSGIFILKGVATFGNNGVPDYQEEANPIKKDDIVDASLYGGFAFDGKLSLDEIFAQIFDEASSSSQHERQLEKLVSKKWRPHDLKAFDRFANDDEHLLVRTSDSERACALSHMAAWHGVVRSLSMIDPEMASSGTLLQMSCKASLCHFTA